MSADPTFDQPAAVDMLIGGDLFPLVVRPKADVIHLNDLPSALEMMLGWWSLAQLLSLLYINLP